MTIYNGKGVYGAIAVGKTYVFKRHQMQIKYEAISDTAAEMKRLEAAKVMAIEQLEEIYKTTLKKVGEAEAAIFDIHMMMIEDEDYNDAIAEIITSQNANAEYAVSVTGERFAEMFSATDSIYMQARSADVRDISNRIISCLKHSANNTEKSDEPVIICSDDLSPSETISLSKNNVLAIVTCGGSLNSHTAILARSMNIPAVIGIGEEFLHAVKNGDMAVVNGFTGEVILNPDTSDIETAENKRNEEQKKKKLLHRCRGKASITHDGRKIKICANIGSVDNIGEVIDNDADGIGLFRSEFVYLQNKDYPTEDEQFEIYRCVLEKMTGKRVIIRTLDIGADKQCDYFKLPKEDNPAMGIRGIRLCLNRPEIFRTQLRALFRASVFGKLGIMFPMIANVWELEEILALCDSVKAELKKDGIEYSEKTELGIMIETPAAALLSHKLAPMVDFFSVGTNDLTQYTLACDRQNPDADRFCNTHHEAVLKLIETAADNAHTHGKWIGICGELAADTTLTETFLKMGIDELSVSPSLVLNIRDTVRKIDLS